MAYAVVVSDNLSPTALPILLVHGWGGSFESTWQRNGFTELLADAGREVIGVDLLGHGTAPKPHDPEAYTDLTPRILDAIGDRCVDAVGFSMGALTLLRMAIDMPERFGKLVLAGIGKNVFERDEAATKRILDAIEGHGSEDDNTSRLFAQYAAQPHNDVAALAALMRRPSPRPFTAEEIAGVDLPVALIVGDRDFVHPPDRLAEALPNVTVKILRNVDHFATPDSFGFIDAALEFLDAIPS
jgi:pimeloyl-ACP methyl ester carboxylesterase